MADKVTLNIGGKIFVTRRNTLQSLKGTRLSRLNEDSVEYDQRTREYFFDRNPLVFGQILDLYRTGVAHFPKCLCGPYLKSELQYWEVTEDAIADCCWKHYKAYEENQIKIESLEAMLSKHELKRVTLQETTPRRFWGECRLKLIFFLEDPESSIAAKVWGVFYLMLVLCSVSVQCLATHPVSRYTLAEPRTNVSQITNPKVLLYLTTDMNYVMWYTDIICTVVFVIDFITRFIVSFNKMDFCKSKYNIVDLIALVPMVIMLTLDILESKVWENRNLYNLVFLLTLLGVFRIFRLVKFARHYHAMRVLLLALRASFREMFLLLLLISIGMLLFSNLIYFAEFDDSSSDFETIPIGFWWSLVTMTTVGYGDVYPHTSWGYLVGGLCAVAGMLSTGLPIPIIASNFNTYCSYLRDSIRIKERKAKQKESRPKVPTGNPSLDGSAAITLNGSAIQREEQNAEISVEKNKCTSKARRAIVTDTTDITSATSAHVSNPSFLGSIKQPDSNGNSSKMELASHSTTETFNLK